MSLMTLATASSSVAQCLVLRLNAFSRCPCLDGRCVLLYCQLSRPIMSQTSGLQWLAGNSHDLGRPPFPPPPFPPSTPQPRQLQLDCHRRPVIGVFRLVARSCVRGAPNEEQRRHDGSRLALNARSCQAFLHTFASPPERQDLQKIKLHRCTISPLVNGARQPQTATDSHRHPQPIRARVVGSLVRASLETSPGSRSL